MRNFCEQISPSTTPTEQRIERYKTLKSNVGTITPVRSRDVPDGLEVLVQASNAGKIQMAFMLSEGSHPTLSGIRIEEMSDGAPQSQQPIAARPENAVLSDIKQLVESKVKTDEFSGTILIARDKEVVWEAAYGLADRNFNIPNQVTTRFDIGSIAKSFTRVAIAQLVEQGKLHLTDTLGQYLPEYPNQAAREKVTIDELLNMQSGIGDFFGLRFQQTPRGDIRSLADYLPLFASEPLAFEPGSKKAYSNGGYVVLGLIVEKVSGESYYDYVQKHIFAPAGMKNTDFPFSDMPHDGEAIGYSKIANEDGKFTVPVNTRRENALMLPSRGSSAGSARSTVRDLLAYSQALTANVLLKSATAEKFQISGSDMGVAGGAPGLNASLDTGIPGAGTSAYSIIIMSNYDPPSAESLARQVRPLLRSAK